MDPIPECQDATAQFPVNIVSMKSGGTQFECRTAEKSMFTHNLEIEAEIEFFANDLCQMYFAMF